MKYLETYRLFEASVPNRNELYRDLIDILYTEIFDDFGIVAKTDETFSDDNPQPENKFWIYKLESSANINDTTSNFDEIGSKKINSIFIYNISESEKDEFWNILFNEVRERVKSQLNQELVIFEESVFIDDLNADVYDHILKLRNLPEDHKKGTKNLPDNEKVKHWLLELDKWYDVKTSEILNQRANYVVVGDYKPVYISGPLFNKNKAVNEIYNDMVEQIIRNLKPDEAVEPSLRAAIKQWIDSRNK